MENRNVENDLIRRGDVLELLYMIKTDKNWPKNYGTLLTIINEVWKMPVAYDKEYAVQLLEDYAGMYRQKSEVSGTNTLEGAKEEGKYLAYKHAQVVVRGNKNE